MHPGGYMKQRLQYLQAQTTAGAKELEAEMLSSRADVLDHG